MIFCMKSIYFCSQYIQPEIGYMCVKDVRPVHCQRILNNMEGLAKDTVKKARSQLYNMFETAKDNSLCATNPASKLAMPQTAEPGTHRAITERERQIILETAKTHPAGAWVLTLLYTGLRPEESIVLRGADIAGGRIHIDKAYDRSTRETKAPKSKAGYRDIPIIPSLAAALPKVEPFELLFKNTRGRPLDEKAMYRMWHRFKAAMQEVEAQMVAQGTIPAFAEELPPLVPYDLRHTYCTDLERAGVPLNVASRLMGHSKIEITARIYTHTGQDMVEQAGHLLTQLHSPTVSPSSATQRYAVKRSVMQALKKAHLPKSKTISAG